MAYYSNRELEFDRFPDNYFKDQDEVEDFFEHYTASHLLEFSRTYPDNDFAFVEVDCFGGKCTSNGFMMKNGVRSFENEPHHSGHMELFSKLDPAANSWFFYPFSRTFFRDKGGVNGEIINVTFPALWLVINVDYGKNTEFDFQLSQNEMMLTKNGQYDLYFMKVDDVRTKIIGTFIVMSQQNLEEVKALIEECFIGMGYYFSLDNFETGEQITLQTMDDRMVRDLTRRSYRANVFNERSFSFNDIVEEKQAQEQKSEDYGKLLKNELFVNVDLQDKIQEDIQDEKSDGISGFFKRFFGKS